MMEHLKLTINAGVKIRREKRNGRTYIVAPMTLIVPGVLSGSQGPLYYPPEEVLRNPEDWEDVPITVNHPREANGFTSAKQPKVLDRVKIGRVYNAHVHDGKLKAEGWFDEEATKRVDPRIYNALQSGSSLELSTGLKPQYRQARQGATWNSQPYSYIAVQPYRPNHLAILPDAEGACSREHGCGVLVNKTVSAGVNDLTSEGSLRQFAADSGFWRNASRLIAGTAALVGNQPSEELDMDPEKACEILKDGEVHGKELTPAQEGMFGALCGKRDKANNQLLWTSVAGSVLPATSSPFKDTRVLNEISITDRLDKIRQAFNDAHPITYDPDSGRPQGICHLGAVYDDYVVYSEMAENETEGMSKYGPARYPLYKQSYSWTDGGEVKFKNNATEVEARVEYVPVENEADINLAPVLRNWHSVRDDIGRFDTTDNDSMRQAIRRGFGPTHSESEDRGSDGMGGPAPTPADESADDAHSPATALGGETVGAGVAVPSGAAA